MKTLRVDLDDGGRLEGHSDLITSGLALHHVRNVQRLLDQFVRPRLTEAMSASPISTWRTACSTHENHTGVFHDGFDRAELHEAFSRARSSTFVTGRSSILKPVPGGAHEFTIL